MPNPNPPHPSNIDWTAELEKAQKALRTNARNIESGKTDKKARKGEEAEEHEEGTESLEQDVSAATKRRRAFHEATNLGNYGDDEYPD